MKQKAKKAGKPRLTVGTLGLLWHGKSTLSAALTRVCAAQGKGVFTPYEELERAPLLGEKNRCFGADADAVELKYETQNRCYTHLDYSGEFLEEHYFAFPCPEGAILVVSASEGVSQSLRKQLWLAWIVGLRRLVVFLNESSLQRDPERSDVVERETRELLYETGFPGDETPVIRGNALLALQGEIGSPGWASIQKLLETLDEYLPLSPPEEESGFLLPIEDVFEVKGRGMVATGRLERGVVQTGNKAELIGMGIMRSVEILGLQTPRKSKERARAGEQIGCLLGGVAAKELQRGQVLATPGSLRPCQRFLARLYLFETERGDAGPPSVTGETLLLLLHSTPVEGRFSLPGGEKELRPGELHTLEITLPEPMALSEGVCFSVQRDYQLSAYGVVTSLLE